MSNHSSTAFRKYSPKRRETLAPSQSLQLPAGLFLTRELKQEVLTIKPLHILHQLVKLQRSSWFFDAISLLYSVE